MWGIRSVFIYFFCYAFFCTNPCLMFDVGSCFLTCFHDCFLMWCRIICGMYLLSWFAMFCLRSLCCYVDGIFMCHHVRFHWDPFYSMLAGCSLSSCMSLCHTDRSPFLLRVPIAEHPLEPILCKGIFLVWQRRHLLCTSPLLTTLNATAYTILTPGLGDVVPPRRTPFSTAYVFMCWWMSCSSSLQHAYVFIYVLLKMQSNTPQKQKALEGSFVTLRPGSSGIRADFAWIWIASVNNWMCSERGWKSDVQDHAQHFPKGGNNVWNSTKRDRGKGVIAASVASHGRGNGITEARQPKSSNR